MSDMSMFMHGIGNEAFEDTPVASDYVRVVVDTAELVGIDGEVRANSAELVESVAQVQRIRETRAYAESIRDSLSEEVAEELQRRVAEVVGSDQAMLIVGSVESYNGSLGNQLLNAGLESIGSVLQKALAFLINLIRTGAKIMMRFFASAKLVLGRQLTAINELRRSVNNKLEGWEEFQITIGEGKGVVVKHGKSGTVLNNNDNVVDIDFGGTADAGDISPTSFYRVHASALGMTKGGRLAIPSPFIPALNDTARMVEDVLIESAIGFDKHYSCVLDVIKDAAKMPEANRLDAMNHLTLDKFLPLSKMTVDRSSNEFQTRINGPVMLGDIQLNITATPKITYAASGRNVNGIDVVSGYATLGMALICVEPQNRTFTGYVNALNKRDSLKALDIVDALLNRVINAGLDKWASDLSRDADYVASRVLPSMYGGNYNDEAYRTALVQGMGNLTRITSAMPRDMVAYTNQMTNAVKHYVELSGKL